MAAVSAQRRDSWDQLSTPPSQQPRIYAARTKTTVRKAHVRDDWDDDSDEEFGVEEVNESIWADADSKTPMPALVISPSSTAPLVVSPPLTVFQSPLRILKRPSPSSSSASSSAETQAHQSFAEREAKYQAARERIFGADAESKDCEGSGPERGGTSVLVHSTNVVRNPRGPEDSRGFGGRRKVVGGVSGKE